MAKERKPDSKAVAEARVELAAIVGELRAAKTRMQAVARRLERAGKRAQPLGELDGEPYTEERWLAGSIRGTVEEGLEDAIDLLSKKAQGVASVGLAAAIALEAKRKAKREARTTRALELVQAIAAVPADPGKLTSLGRAKLQEEFCQVAHDLGWLRPCYLNTPGGDEAYRKCLANHGLTVETMAMACGGYYAGYAV
jgi:chromosome segregation ATPase